MNEPDMYRTKSGRILSDRDLADLVAEAEHGYDPEKLIPRRGRPRMGSAPAAVVPVRLHTELHDAVKNRATAIRTSVSDLVRQALFAYLESAPVAVDGLRTRSGRVLDESELDALASEAEIGYEPDTLRLRAPRGRARAEVVPVRFPPELKAAVERRADIESTSVSDVVRSALRAFLKGPQPDPPPSGTGHPTASRRPTEADTCRDYVVPRLKEAGWDDDQIVEQYRITDGRIITVGEKHRRAAELRADYVLEYRPGVPIGVVEAKRQHSDKWRMRSEP